MEQSILALFLDPLIGIYIMLLQIRLDVLRNYIATSIFFSPWYGEITATPWMSAHCQTTYIFFLCAFFSLFFVSHRSRNSLNSKQRWASTCLSISESQQPMVINQKQREGRIIQNLRTYIRQMIYLILLCCGIPSILCHNYFLWSI